MFDRFYCMEIKFMIWIMELIVSRRLSRSNLAKRSIIPRSLLNRNYSGGHKISAQKRVLYYLLFRLCLLFLSRSFNTLPLSPSLYYQFTASIS